MSEDVVIFPFNCVPGFHSHLWWIEMSLLDEDYVICLASRPSLLCPEAHNRKKCHRHSSQEKSSTLQQGRCGEWSARSRRAVVLIRMLLAPPHLTPIRKAIGFYLLPSDCSSCCACSKCPCRTGAAPSSADFSSAFCTFGIKVFLAASITAR